MKPAALILGAMLAVHVASPVAAQPGPAPDCPFLAPGCDRLPRLFGDLDRDLGPLLREFEREFGRDLDDRLAPLFDRLGRRLDPVLRELIELMGDLTGWEAPEVLPNGDILIRRRRPAPPVTPDQPPVEPPYEPPTEPSDAPPVTEPFEL